MIARYAAVAALVALLACGRERKGAAQPDTVAPVARDAAGAAPAAAAPVVMFVGTSLTAGLGVEPDQAYPALIQQKIDSAGLNYRVVNAGVSGETSAGALRRIDWLLREPVADPRARDRCQRRAAGTGPGLDPGQHPGDHRPGAHARSRRHASSWWG